MRREVIKNIISTIRIHLIRDERYVNEETLSGNSTQSTHDQLAPIFSPEKCQQI